MGYRWVGVSEGRRFCVPILADSSQPGLEAESREDRLDFDEPGPFEELEVLASGEGNEDTLEALLFREDLRFGVALLDLEGSVGSADAQLDLSVVLPCLLGDQESALWLKVAAESFEHGEPVGGGNELQDEQADDEMGVEIGQCAYVFATEGNARVEESSALDHLGFAVEAPHCRLGVILLQASGESPDRATQIDDATEARDKTLGEREGKLMELGVPRHGASDVSIEDLGSLAAESPRATGDADPITCRRPLGESIRELQGYG